MTQAAATPNPLLAHGLLDQLFAHIGRWFGGLTEQLADAGQALLQVGSLGPWWRALTHSPDVRNIALHAGVTVIVIFAVSLLAEFIFGGLLGRAAAHLRHGTLRSDNVLTRIPYALVDVLLYITPLAAFIVASGLLVSALLVADSMSYAVARTLIDAYIHTRIGLAVVRLVVSPAGHEMRLLRATDRQARYVWRWALWLLAAATFGTALARIVALAGASASVSALVLKVVALAVHGMAIVIVLQTQRTMSDRIRPSPDARHNVWTGARRLFADTWAYVAIFFIAALWVVWALGVSDGFDRIVHFFAITVAVAVAARLVWIILLGALDHMFQRWGGTTESAAATLGARYRSFARRLIGALLLIAALLVLLQSWGIPVSEAFAEGTLGRRAAHALGTIVVAALLAILVWEASGYLLQRRLSVWTSQGDMVRVARLRTLIPILRTLLLVAIGLIVVFTALSELGVNTAPLLAGASIIGVALGFGSQKLVQDFITGIFLLMENAMQVGDSVTIAGVAGVVEHLSIRTVRLRAGDGSLNIVPFSSVTTVNNTNRGLGNASVQVSVTSDSDIDKVLAELARIGNEMRQDPVLGPLILGDIEIWGVDQIDGARAAITGQIRSLDRGRWTVQRDFNRRVLQRFRQVGITLANPREMLVRDVSPPDAP